MLAAAALADVTALRSIWFARRAEGLGHGIARPGLNTGEASSKSKLDSCRKICERLY